MNIWWSVLVAVAAGVACWGLDRIVRKSEDDLIAEYLNSQRPAPPHDPPASEEVERRWARQGKILDMISAVEVLECEARKKKLFSVAQQLQTVIAVLDREYDLCRRSPDAFRITETWEK